MAAVRVELALGYGPNFAEICDLTPGNVSATERLGFNRPISVIGESEWYYFTAPAERSYGVQAVAD